MRTGSTTHRGVRGTKTSFFIALSISTVLALAANPGETVAAQQGQSAKRSAQAYTPPPAPSVAPELLAAQRNLDSRLAAIGRGFNGDVGIAVKDLQSGWASHYDGAAHFPQQSVSKFWVALTALDKADRGEIDLAASVTVRRSDLTLFNQPIAQLVKGEGYTTTLSGLMQRSLQQSDNTANDFILRRAGGPDAVRAFLTRNRIEGVRFGPGERLMQSEIAGLSWNPAYSEGRAFYQARSSVPLETRRASFNRYVSDPVDGATPLGIVNALGRLHKGELLSPASTRQVLAIMSNTRTGPQRLKGGLAPGWNLAHKTGTGQVLGATQSGYNDIGILTAPDGRAYAVAAMIRTTAAPNPERMAMMQDVTRAVIDYHREVTGLNVAVGTAIHSATVSSR